MLDLLRIKRILGQSAGFELGRSGEGSGESWVRWRVDGRVGRSCCETCHLDEQNPRCLEDLETLDFQNLCCSNLSDGFRNLGGGRETRGDRDGILSKSHGDDILRLYMRNVKKMLFEGDDYKVKVVKCFVY
nr:hypothetical protein [Tanacetum cinerariifolium]